VKRVKENDVNEKAINGKKRVLKEGGMPAGPPEGR